MTFVGINFPFTFRMILPKGFRFIFFFPIFFLFSACLSQMNSKKGGEGRKEKEHRQRDQKKRTWYNRKNQQGLSRLPTPTVSQNFPLGQAVPIWSSDILRFSLLLNGIQSRMSLLTKKYCKQRLGRAIEKSKILPQKLFL